MNFYACINLRVFNVSDWAKIGFVYWAKVTAWPSSSLPLSAVCQQGSYTHSLLLYMLLLYINIHLADTSVQSDMQTGNATANIHTIHYTMNTNFHHCFKKVSGYLTWSWLMCTCFIKSYELWNDMGYFHF